MIEGFNTWLEGLPLSVAIAEGDWYFPIIESVHVLALAVVFGSILMVDLRLLNMTLKNRSVLDLSRDVLPWTWAAFILAAATGALMFISAATRYYDLWPFKLKMVLLICAGLNMLVFHIGSYQRVGEWGTGGLTPQGAQLSGGISIVLWTSIIVCGRWIGFL